MPLPEEPKDIRESPSTTESVAKKDDEAKLDDAVREATKNDHTVA